MSEEQTPSVDGLIVYADGSFRRQAAGWGIHAYTYQKTPLTRGIGNKQVPTPEGYQPVALPDTVTPLEYIDAYGAVTENPTNNTGELSAVIKAFALAEQLKIYDLLVFSDSTYVRDGLTKHLKTWVKNNWIKSNGEPVMNPTYWKALLAAQSRWEELGYRFEIRWIRGHSKDLGNEMSDLNARLGSGNRIDFYQHNSGPEGYHNPKVQANPLIMKTRMLFNMGGESHHVEGQGHYYYCYQLGRLSTYGHKQGDSKLDRHQKTDLLLGRRISDATFAVLRFHDPDPFLDKLQDVHTQTHQKDIVELAAARLDTAYRPAIYDRIQKMGPKALVADYDNESLLTAHDDLITKTLNPPRLARDAVEVFGAMQQTLDDYIAGKRLAGLTRVPLTEQLYDTDSSGKKMKTRLKKEITSATRSLDYTVDLKGTPVTVKLLVGIDIPNRNALAKLAEEEVKVTLLVAMDGPHAYSYSTVFETRTGTAIYQSPYTQFVIPKTPSKSKKA